MITDHTCGECSHWDDADQCCRLGRDAASEAEACQRFDAADEYPERED